MRVLDAPVYLRRRPPRHRRSLLGYGLRIHTKDIRGSVTLTGRSTSHATAAAGKVSPRAPPVTLNTFARYTGSELVRTCLGPTHRRRSRMQRIGMCTRDAVTLQRASVRYTPTRGTVRPCRCSSRRLTAMPPGTADGGVLTHTHHAALRPRRGVCALGREGPSRT